MSKNNVHPDHYKVGGRDRQDDAAAARFARSVAAKAASQQRPDRMTNGPYFQRPEPAAPLSAAQPAKRAQKKGSLAAGAAKKSTARKASPPRKPAVRSRKSAAASARPTKKR